MKLIQSKFDYKLMGTNETFPKGVYLAISATNQPEYKEKGKVFIHNLNGCDLLLSNDDYILIEDFS